MKNILFIIFAVMFFSSACGDIHNDLWNHLSRMSSDKQITSFEINGYKARISGLTINSVLPYGTSVKALKPQITYNGYSISPESGETRDFTNPVPYTVTADNGTTAVYTVSVKVLTVAEMSNANLSSLRVKKGKLQPALNSTDVNYLDAPIPFSDSENPAYNDKQSNSLIADPEILIASMKINGIAIDNAAEHLISNLEVGPNDVEIVVIAADKATTKTYNLNMYRAVPIFKTGAGEISGYDLNPLEDGATQRGVSWPNPRFYVQSTSNIVGGNEKEETVVEDRLTGLYWLNQTTESSIDLSAAYNYSDALSNASGIPRFATSPYEWHLPNIREIRSLANYCGNGNDYIKDVFSNYNINYEYWSSTIYIGESTKAFPFEANNNRSTVRTKDEEKYLFVVRGNSSILPKTGQTKTQSLLNGDDGNLQKGVVWPTTRFYKDENNAIVDNMTSLMWHPSSITPTVTEDYWNSSISFIEANNEYGFSDWSLPNVNEIETLTNYSSDNLDWLSPKIIVDSTLLWTSTSFNTLNAYVLNSNAQIISYGQKADISCKYLPVRQAKIINY